MNATVEAVYYVTKVLMGFRDRDAAKAAYDKISAALKEYQKFRNDRVEVVEVDTENGLTSLKLERMDAVLFNEPQEFDEDAWRKCLIEEKRVRELREELGLPPPTAQVRAKTRQ